MWLSEECSTGNSKCEGPKACDCQACVRKGEEDNDVETQ